MNALLSTKNLSTLWKKLLSSARLLTAFRFMSKRFLKKFGKIKVECEQFEIDPLIFINIRTKILKILVSCGKIVAVNKISI